MNCTTLEFAKRTARKMKRETGEEFCVVELVECWDIMRLSEADGQTILYTTADD